MTSRRPLTKIVIEARHAVNFRARKIERLRSEPDRVAMDETECFVQRQKDCQKTPILLSRNNFSRFVFVPVSPVGHAFSLRLSH